MYIYIYLLIFNSLNHTSYSRKQKTENKIKAVNLQAFSLSSLSFSCFNYIV